jgi:outer membrane protein OmpA-like peptidoglycan-associated protein
MKTTRNEVDCVRINRIAMVTLLGVLTEMLPTTTLAEVRILPDKVESSSGVLFETNSANILPESRGGLDALALELRQNAQLRIEIQVYSDSRGSAAYNLRMSHERARALYDYLIQAGVPAERLAYQGFGETCPVSSNRSGAGRNQNRRIIFWRLDAGNERNCPIPPPPPPPPPPDPSLQFPDPEDAARQQQ